MLAAWTQRLSRRAPWLLISVAIATIPVLAAGASIFGTHWHSSSDQGIELLRIADVGTRHTMLTGLWSRLGWSHPGPALIWLLSPFEWVAGETGVLIGVAFMNAIAVGGAVLLAARRDGERSAVLTALALALLVHALGPSLLVDPWNPWVPVLPFALFLVAAWGVSDGDSVLLPVAVGVGSFCVQSHVGYALLVVGVLAAAFALGRGARRRHLVLAALVGLTLWLPPLVEQATSSTGNLGAILGAARHPAAPVAGWTTAAGVLGAELRVPGPWLTGNDPDVTGVLVGGRVLPALLVFAALACTTAFAWRRGAGAPSTARLCALAAAAALLGLASTAQQQGLLAPYLVRWWWVVAALA
ncbi:MAG: hypothetical protein QOI47_2014, partial [Actinomycetota bacterium]|nr:hypothetical protein [Actinomycetota bacterium]